MWSNGETRRITSNPMKPASMKMKRLLIRIELFILSSVNRIIALHRGARHARKTRAPVDSRLHPVGDQGFAHDFVVQIELQLLVFDQV